MSKSFLFALSACLAMTGCQSFRTSPIWKKIVHARIELPREGDTSKRYAMDLHGKLTADGIEHKVVTYQYRHHTRRGDEVPVERSVVIYRDDTKAKYPWWLKDHSSNRPVWLPNGSVEEQLRFYSGREVQIVESGHRAGGDGKEIAHLPQPVEKQITSSKKHTASSKKQTASSKKQTASSKKQTASSKKHTASSKKRTASLKKHGASPKRFAATSKAKGKRS